MRHKITRRAVVKGALMASAMAPALGLIGKTASSATTSLPALDPHEPTAVTLGFVNDSPHTADQNCANCEQFIGKPSDLRGGCVLFPGKSVPAAGWCKVWRKKP
jgi:hypothetical protein